MFPGETLGPAFVKAARAPLPQAPLMPTGGVSMDNAAEWIKAGSVALGVGGQPDGGREDRRFQIHHRSGAQAYCCHPGSSRMTRKVVTFGEIMLRLAPPGFERFLQSPQFVATFGGAEANVAVALASFGLPASFVTVLPANIRSPMLPWPNCGVSV